MMAFEGLMQVSYIAPIGYLVLEENDTFSLEAQSHKHNLVHSHCMSRNLVS